MEKNQRYEVNSKGELVIGEPNVCSNRKQMLEQLFTRNGWVYEVLSEVSGAHFHVKVSNSNLEKEFVFHLFHGNVRKEDPDRNRAEKKIQLGGLDPREIENEMCIILGVYVYESERIDDAVIVAWPVEEGKNYPNNPSLRVNMQQEIVPAKNNGIYFDLSTGKQIVAFKPEFIYYYLENYKDLHGYGQPRAKDKEASELLNHDFYGMHITRRNSAVEQGEISIGWSALGDLTDINSKEELSVRMDETFPDKKPRSKAQDISQVWTFRGDMKIGDYVVFSDGKQAHIGVIKSDYYYEIDENNRDIDYVNNRKVEWLKSIDRELLPKVFRSALASARSVFSLNAYKSIILELLEKDVLDYDEEDYGEEESMEEQRPYIELNFKTNIECDYERNRIVFGAPGTGKSFQMEEDRKTVLATLGGGYERVTFHPDYTYSSFVGCYKPVSEKGKIEYKYVPGPFMRVLVQALRSGLKDEVAKPYLLVIEEINRAKVAAVFGEVFQLLDRDENGTSDYEINASEDVKQYLSDELGGSLESFDKIRIPNNMFIWASMNSADQGVFPMDTAFKRRWSFEYKGIDENEDKVGGKIVLGKGEYELEVDWNDLRKAINDVLARTFKINEDKLMGPFFIGEEVFAFDKETGMIKNPEKFKKVFKSKVIMYLFEDAAKQHKHKLFSGCDATTYSAICNKFDEIGIDIFGADFRTTYFAK